MSARGAVSLTAAVAVLLWSVSLATAVEPCIVPNQPATQVSAAQIIPNLTLVGVAVADSQGQKIGQIKHVLLDAPAGQATFVVLAPERAGAGQGSLVIPFQALRITINSVDGHRSVVLDRRTDQLRAAPQIQDNHWSLLQNPQFLDQARSFYQVKTYYTAARPIDNMSPPGLPVAPPPVVQFSPNYGLPRFIEDFYME
jgi:sporulation protein YlmC with PRC-barrel domain